MVKRSRYTTGINRDYRSWFTSSIVGGSPDNSADIALSVASNIYPMCPWRGIPLPFPADTTLSEADLAENLLLFGGVYE